MTWLCISFVVFWFSGSITCTHNFPPIILWALVVLLIYRCITMSFGHVSILLFDFGKTTGEKGKIHSRSRYLALTAVNYFEFLLWNSSISVWLQPINSESNAYSKPFYSYLHVVYYNFVTITTLGYGDIFPDPCCRIAQLQTIWGTTFSILILAVIINIVVNINKKDEIMGHFNLQEYWAWRAPTFNEIEWASNRTLQDSIVNKMKDYDVNVIADLGCGVGIQSRILAKQGYKVIGVDNSTEMIHFAKQEQMDGIEYRIRDVGQTGIKNASIDAVLLCMVLHNVFPDWTDVLVEAARILKPEGVLIVVEGMPPSPECSKFFKKVLSKVHPRQFFSREELIDRIVQSNFEIQAEEDLIIKGLSIKNWLQRSVWNAEERPKLLINHQNMPKKYRGQYNYTRRNDDVLIDISFLIVTAKLFKRNGGN